MSSDGHELQHIEAHITRLKRLHAVAEGKTWKGQLSEEQIRQARSVSLANILDIPLRKSGKNLVACCPLHQERTPSFVVYTETNTWRCYGACSKGGDAISLVRALHGSTFREAVRYLIKGNYATT